MSTEPINGAFAWGVRCILGSLLLIAVIGGCIAGSGCRSRTETHITIYQPGTVTIAPELLVEKQVTPTLNVKGSLK